MEAHYDDELNGHVMFGPSGDAAFPVRCMLIRQNYQRLWKDGNSEVDALDKLRKYVAIKIVEESEPYQL